MNNSHNHRFIAVYKNPHIWYITLLTLAASILAFQNFILDAIGLPHTEWGVIFEAHSLHWALFLLPLLYAAYVFGVRGAVIIISIVTLLFISHTVLLLPAELGHLFADTAFFVLVCTTGVLIGVLRNQRQQIQKAYTTVVESWENLRAYLESAPDGIYLNDLKGKFLYGNKKAEEIMGYKREELIGKSFLKLNILPKKHLVKAGKLLALNAIGRPTGPDELELIRKDGSRVWVEINTAPIKQQGEVVILGFVRDITERKRMEQALHLQSEIAVNMSEGVYLIGLNDVVIRYANPKFEEMFGYEPGEMIGKHVSIVNAPTDKRPEESAKEIMEVIYRTGEWHGEINNIKKDGTPFWCYANVSVFTHPEYGEVLVAVHTDITERKRVEEALRESEERFRDIAENTLAWIWEVNVNGEYTYASNICEKILGYKPEELIGKHFYDLFPPDEREKLKEAAFETFTKKQPFREFINQNIHKNGEIVWLSTNGAPILDERGNLLGYRGVDTDITERKRWEKKIKESEEKFRSIFQSAHDGLIHVDKSGEILDANEKALQFFAESKEELLGKHFTSVGIFSPKDIPVLMGNFTKILTGKKPLITLHIKNKKGEEKDLEFSADLIKIGNEVAGVTFVVRDITEHKQTEEREKQLQQQLNLTSRLASIGEMASGIAHEINNPLTGVIGFAQLLMQRDLPEDIRKDVETINDGAQRVAGIVSRLLTFAHQHKPGRKYINISDAITSVLELRSYEMKVNNIEVVTQLAPHLPQTMADVNQLQQVFLNIIINAEKEMTAAHHRGKLSVKTERINSSIRVSFTDDGSGISKENLDKVFNPFFTTRKVGNGTGLGLSICHGIITQHNGRIYAQSELGKGATFVVELPIVAKTRQLKKAEATKEEPWQRSGAKILVVDDETAILDFLKRLLTGQGYQVETVDGTRAALTKLRREGYDLILLDIKLPGKSGIWLYRHIEAMDPALAHRVLFITGDVKETSTREFLDKTKVRYIAKPLNVEQLKRDINHMLNREPLRQQS